MNGIICPADPAVLLRFTATHPVWSRRLVQMGGDTPDALDELTRMNLLDCQDDLFWLNERGRAAFTLSARACFLDELPGSRPADPVRRARLTELWLTLDKGHRQRWGLKDYKLDVNLDVRPAPTALWEIQDGTFRWLWPQSPEVIRAAREFPLPRLRERDWRGPQAERQRQWHDAFTRSARLKADLLYLSRYDEAYYRDFPGYPGDPFGLVNADRFFFSFETDLRRRLDLLGLYQLWLNQLRRSDVPGYLDIDTQEQDAVNWLIFMSPDSETARSDAATLRNLGNLTSAAMPMEMWTASLEGLQAAGTDHEVIWDLLTPAAHAVNDDTRTNPPT